MNMIKLTIALAVAIPVAVQAQAPATQAPAAHQGHGTMQHETMDHGSMDHDAMTNCCEGDEAGRMACCERMRAQGHAMPCCDEAGEEPGAPSPQ